MSSSVLADDSTVTFSDPNPLTDLSVRDLLELFERSEDMEALESLRTRWVEAVGADRATDMLIEVVSAGPPRDRDTAFSWLTQLGQGESAIRRSLDDPAVRPYGVVWLREMGLPGPDPTPDEVRWVYVDLLAVALDDEERLAPAAFRQVAADGSLEEEIQDVFDVWECDHPATFDVLDMMGRLHPEPGVAKAARQAAVRAGGRLQAIE